MTDGINEMPKKRLNDLWSETETNEKDFPKELLGNIHAKRKEDFERFKVFVSEAVKYLDSETVRGRVAIMKVKNVLG